MSEIEQNRGEGTGDAPLPRVLEVAFARSPDGVAKLARLVESLGGSDPGLGLDGLVGLASAVLADRALEATPPWTRTLAATQAYGLSETETLDAYRIDGAQLPRLRRWRAALQAGSNEGDLEGFDARDVEDAEWLLRMMCVRSDLTGQVAGHASRVAGRLREASRARASLASALPIAHVATGATRGEGVARPAVPTCVPRRLDA